MKEETLLETKIVLLGNQPGDYTLKHFYHKPQDVSQSSNYFLSWLSICPNAGIVATVSMGLGCGWIATRAVADNHAVENHNFHNNPSQLSFTSILSSKPHHHLISVSSMQTAGEHFLLCLRVFLAFPSDLQILSGYFRVTGRFNCLFVFSLCVCVLFFYSFYHGISL